MGSIAQNIKRYRQKRKMTQKELAKKAGIDFFTLSKVETGVTSNPTIETVMKIAAALGVSINHLMKEK